MLGIKIAYYRKQDWEKFCAMIDDRESMHDTWKEWHSAFQKRKKDFIKQGFEVVEVEVDIDDLVLYCKSRGLRNDGETRAEYVRLK